MPLGANVDFPPSAHVRCPLRRFHLRPAARCDGCEHFRGLAELTPIAQLEFELQFRVRCAYPTDRELLHVETP